MNLMTDFAFKRLFGSEERKDILINFLNIIFEKDAIKVNDVIYHDKEILPQSHRGKRIIYDVYCTVKDTKEHIILEMQQLHHANFENRAILYEAYGIVSQSVRGENYGLNPVYSIFLVGFDFRHMSSRMIHDIRLRDIDTGRSSQI